MQELALYIYKKFGLKLTLSDIEEVLQWYENNSDRLTDEETTEEEMRKYLYTRFSGRPMHIQEEDLSNMNYLLSMLKGSRKSK